MLKAHLLAMFLVGGLHQIVIPPTSPQNFIVVDWEGNISQELDSALEQAV